jgi:Asp-tRNA(Asn)/Glu-tRNA(Gln) amidotransferase A subunit family amidase
VTRSEDLSLLAVISRLRKGSISAVEALTLCLQRIERFDGDLQAWVTLDSEGALEQARARDMERSQGRIRGPLHGVPVGIKDNFMTRGLRTTVGSPIFENYVPDHDAVAVARLKEAGAVILGKAVTAQFAALDPGPTRNPWNRSHTPGGSSSGSAAAVAAGMCPVATGTQTAASIGRPAAFCGIVGLMPTAALISREGVFPSAWSLDHVGAFGRSVEDVSLMVSAMSGQALSSREIPEARDLKVGVVGEYFEEHTDPEAWQVHNQFIERLRGAPVQVTELTLPDVFAIALPALRTIMRSEIAAIHDQLHRKHAELYGPNLRGMVEAGQLISATEYLRARRLRRMYQNEVQVLLEDCDVVISPGARGEAPRGIESTGDPVASVPWTLADLPTLSLPIGLGRNALPVGIQLTAPRFGEERLVTIGKWFESFAEFRHDPDLA